MIVLSVACSYHGGWVTEMNRQCTQNLDSVVQGWTLECYSQLWIGCDKACHCCPSDAYPWLQELCTQERWRQLWHLVVWQSPESAGWPQWWSLTEARTRDILFLLFTVHSKVNGTLSLFYGDCHYLRQYLPAKPGKWWVRKGQVISRIIMLLKIALPSFAGDLLFIVVLGFVLLWKKVYLDSWFPGDKCHGGEAGQ